MHKKYPKSKSFQRIDYNTEREVMKLAQTFPNYFLLENIHTLKPYNLQMISEPKASVQV